MSEPIHLHPTAPLADRVLLPGDPGRALLLAQSLLTEPKMFNHSRGLWGYSGTAADGAPLTIQSTGMGGPSAAIVVSELIDLGARTLLRVGTCGALAPQLALGQLLVADEAIADDGTSRALGAGPRVAADPALVARLEAACGERVAADEGVAGGERVAVGPVVSTDLFYGAIEPRWVADGALAVEMEAATLFALAGCRGCDAAALLLVTDLLIPERQRIDPGSLRDGEYRLGAVAASALAG